MTDADDPTGGRGVRGSVKGGPFHRLCGAALVHGVVRNARLTVLSGPSGVGASTVVAAVRAKCPEIWLPVPVTTRPRRPGEVDGRDYHFISDEAFGRMAGHGGLLGWGRFAGTGYGIQKAPVMERVAAGVPVLLAIDVEGARQVRREVPGALLVFLALPPLACTGAGGGDETSGVWRHGWGDGIEAGREFDITLVNSRVEDVSEQLVRLMLA